MEHGPILARPRELAVVVLVHAILAEAARPGVGLVDGLTAVPARRARQRVVPGRDRVERPFQTELMIGDHVVEQPGATFRQELTDLRFRQQLFRLIAD
jgi:hypothetical protein